MRGGRRSAQRRRRAQRIGRVGDRPRAGDGRLAVEAVHHRQEKRVIAHQRRNVCQRRRQLPMFDRHHHQVRRGNLPGLVGIEHRAGEGGIVHHDTRLAQPPRPRAPGDEAGLETRCGKELGGVQAAHGAGAENGDFVYGIHGRDYAGDIGSGAQRRRCGPVPRQLATFPCCSCDSFIQKPYTTWLNRGNICPGVTC